jgi:uncharacterized protein with gpF-like domain
MNLIVPRSKIVKTIIKVRRPKPLLYPVGIENIYIISSKNLINSWISLYNSIIIPILPLIYSEYPIKIDSWHESLNAYIAILEGHIKNSVSNFKNTIVNIADRTTHWNSRQWEKHVKFVLGKTFMSNASHKQEIKNAFIDKEVSKFNSIATGAIDIFKNASISAIKNNRLEPDLNLKALKAQTEKGLTLSIASFNSELYRDEQLGLGIEEYIWRTMRDLKVRDSHRPLEGKICSWKDPTIFKYTQDGTWISKSSIGGVMLHVGEDYNCRCYPEANFLKLLGGD